jgi:SAM-dependent methyltransferase
MTDWGDGTYELTAETLEPASARAIEIAGIEVGERALDVACGTGNASVVAAYAGARVTGVDVSARLLDVARGRLPEAEFLEGDGAALPVADDAFDLALSVFGVIFVPDPAAAVRELVRAVRPGGRIVFTSWIPEGAIAGAGRIIGDVLRGGEPAPADEEPPVAVRWGDPFFLEELFAPHGSDLRVVQDTLVFRAASPEAWLAEQEEHHPMWRAAQAAFAAEGRAEAWAEVQERTLALLHEHNEDEAAFRASSPYLVTRADLPG